MLIAGIGKRGADSYIRPFDGRSVTATGVRIVREGCVILGIAKGDIKSNPTALLPPQPMSPLSTKTVELIGQVLDAQCFMGIMNPGYGRTHRACATQCIRGGQPVFFSLDINSAQETSGQGACSGQGYILASPNGGKINNQVLGDIAVPMILEARLENIGNLSRLIPIGKGLRRL